MKSRYGDHAFTARSLYGTQVEHTYSGALSFLRRKYTRDLDGVDVAVTGIPFDLATTNRPGTRFGPASIRAASAHLSWGPPWPWGFDPTERLAIVDYGDCSFDFGRPDGIPREIEAHAESIIAHDVSLLCLGGDHFMTLPLLRAHAKRHGPLALITSTLTRTPGRTRMAASTMARCFFTPRARASSSPNTRCKSVFVRTIAIQ